MPVADVRSSSREFLDHVRRNAEGALAEIRDTGKLTDENIERLEGLAKEFKQGFTASDGSSVAPKEAPAERDGRRRGGPRDRQGPQGAGLR